LVPVRNTAATTEIEATILFSRTCFSIFNQNIEQQNINANDGNNRSIFNEPEPGSVAAMLVEYAPRLLGKGCRDKNAYLA
jgi:hypothetical protein